MMEPERIEPVLLKAPSRRERTWFYPWLGLLLGAGLGVLVGHPLSMLVHNIHTHIYDGAPLDISGSLIHSFHIQMWPMVALFALFGGVVWAVIGLIFQRLRENRLRLDSLHQEFELQVATLRHHYKNLALGIHGFSSRIQRKLTHLDEQMRQCAQGDCPTYNGVHQDLETLKKNVTILEEVAERLSHTLGQELLFLKALTSDSLNPEPRDFYPLLIHAVKDLLGLRFREKAIRVELNGLGLDECRDTLLFAFEPYTMEVIFQNILSNAMIYGDVIQIRVLDRDDRVRVEIQDNGPGLEAEKLQYSLLLPGDRHEESTHLGLRVSLHLLEKLGGSLSLRSRPGAGAAFIVEIPKLA